MKDQILSAIPAGAKFIDGKAQLPQQGQLPVVFLWLNEVPHHEEGTWTNEQRYQFYVVYQSALDRNSSIEEQKESIANKLLAALTDKSYLLGLCHFWKCSNVLFEEVRGEPETVFMVEIEILARASTNIWETSASESAELSQQQVS